MYIIHVYLNMCIYFCIFFVAVGFLPSAHCNYNDSELTTTRAAIYIYKYIPRHLPLKASVKAILS